jgi:hypothetical protein
MEINVTPVALAFTFSPTLPRLMEEAAKIREHNDSMLFLIHAGPISASEQTQLHTIIETLNIPPDKHQLICSDGDPEEMIRGVCAELGIGLLIIGALVKEGFLNYYSGSLARALMREPPASLFILTGAATDSLDFKHACATVDFSPEGEAMIAAAYRMALKLQCGKLTLLREFLLPGLAITVHDSGSSDETESIRHEWEEQELKKIEMLITEMRLKDVPVVPAIVYGKQGYEAACYAREHRVDLLIIPAPKKRLKLLDRIFQHDQEYFFKELPCSLLCLKIG